MAKTVAMCKIIMHRDCAYHSANNCTFDGKACKLKIVLLVC